MSRLAFFVLGLVVGGGLVYGAERYHVLRTNQGFETVPKLSASFSDVYVDVREFTASDWAERQGLAADVLRAHKEYLIKDAVVDQVRQKVNGLLQEFGPAEAGL
ncbi:MAG TPA: hypothetical protein VHB99_20450 [Pirellulales bacterium]|nr:hypothetical protein [Pirellulales bacterium]